MKRIVRIVVLAIALFIIYVSSRPGTFHVERSVSIPAPPQVVYAKIADFHQWGEWSPWEKLDPQMVKTYGGPESGTGATYHWKGNQQVGEGNMAITEARPNERIVIKLDFIKPFTATNTTSFALTPDGANTKVVWAMDGENNFLAKAMTLFMNMDKQIGGDFEKGLAQLSQTSASAATSGETAAPDSSAASKP